MDQEWKKWEPVKAIPSRLYVERLLDDINGFLIEMTSEDEKVSVKVYFDQVMAFRSSDEGKRIETVYFLSEKYGKGFFDGLCFKVEGSDFLNWFKTESCGIYDSIGVEHYAFITDNDIIDVLSVQPPEISVFNNS